MVENISEEEQTKGKEQLEEIGIVASFRRGWDAVANLIRQLTGVGEETAKNAMLVAIGPLLTAVATFINWVYLYVHYHIIYNVPVKDLTVSTSILVRFAAIAIVVGIVTYVSYQMLKLIRKHMRFLGKPSTIIIISTIAIVVIACVALIQYRYKINYDDGIITAQFSKSMGSNEIDIAVKLVKIELLLLGWMASLPQLIQLGIMFFLALIVLPFVIATIWYMVEANFSSNREKASNVERKKKFDVVIKAAIIVLVIALPIVFFALDDGLTRASPYAITSDQTQVIVYMDKDYCILEPATIDSDGTLIIDTSQPKPGDATSLTYSYETFKNVITK